MIILIDGSIVISSMINYHLLMLYRSFLYFLIVKVPHLNTDDFAQEFEIKYCCSWWWPPINIYCLRLLKIRLEDQFPPLFADHPNNSLSLSRSYSINIHIYLFYVSQLHFLLVFVLRLQILQFLADQVHTLSRMFELIWYLLLDTLDCLLHIFFLHTEKFHIIHSPCLVPLLQLLYAAFEIILAKGDLAILAVVPDLKSRLSWLVMVELEHQNRSVGRKLKDAAITLFLFVDKYLIYALRTRHSELVQYIPKSNIVGAVEYPLPGVILCRSFHVRNGLADDIVGWCLELCFISIKNDGLPEGVVEMDRSRCLRTISENIGHSFASESHAL